MVVLKVFNKDSELIKTLELKEEDTINTRMKRKKSILDILLDNGVPIFYGCMGGSCSACVCEHVSGDEYIDREGNGVQVFQGIEKEDFLSCIATIKGSIVDSDKVIEIKLKI